MSACCAGRASRTAAIVLCGIAITSVAAIFGGYSVLSSAVFHGSTVNGVVYAFLRDVTGSILLLGSAYIVERRKGAAGRWMIDASDSGHFILLGLLGVYGSQGMSALAVQQTTPTFFASMANLQPAVALTLAAALGYERFVVREVTAWAKAAGILIAVGCAVATVLLASDGGGDSITSQSKNFPLGCFYMALQITLGGSLAVAQKPLYAKYPPLVVAGWGYCMGTLILAACIAVGANTSADWDINWDVIAGVAYSGILSSGLAYGVMSWVNNRQGPIFVMAFLPSQALFTALFAWIFQGKNLPGVVALPMIGMICGILTIVAAQWREASLGLGPPKVVKSLAAASAQLDGKGDGLDGHAEADGSGAESSALLGGARGAAQGGMVEWGAAASAKGAKASVGGALAHGFADIGRTGSVQGIAFTELHDGEAAR